ncbi:MAG: cell division protein ZapA [Ruminococcaceae bacterium]|nr:cell division protein ZapA [Oscillospiraceae bacterium]
MNKVRLTICGSEYALSTDEAPEYMQDLAGRIERAMQELLVNPRISLSMAAVLVALEQADTAEKALLASDNLRAQMKEYLDDNARARMEADRLRQENSLLRQKLAMYGQE